MLTTFWYMDLEAARAEVDVVKFFMLLVLTDYWVAYELWVWGVLSSASDDAVFMIAVIC